MRNKNIIYAFGMIILILIVGMFLVFPTLGDEAKDRLTPGEDGRYIGFSVRINRDVMGEPTIEQGSEGLSTSPMSILSILDSKVIVDIGNYKKIETNYKSSGIEGGSFILVTPQTYVPFGRYTAQFTLHNKGGETCFPLGCEWTPSPPIITREIYIDETGGHFV